MTALEMHTTSARPSRRAVTVLRVVSQGNVGDWLNVPDLGSKISA